MKQTKTLVAVLALALIFTLGLSLVACGGDATCTEHVDKDANGKCDNCDANVEPDDGGGDTAASIELVKNGAPTFNIVSTDEVSSTLGKTLTNFVKTLNDCFENGTVSAVLEQTDAVGTEIIIGNVSTRGDNFKEEKASPYEYGYDGWAVKIVDGNILVLAGSAGAYKDALAYLEQTVFGISDSTNSIGNVTMTAEQEKVEKQTDFDVSVKIDGNPLSEYVFAINTGDSFAIKAINNVRVQIFKKTGVYLKTVVSNKLADGQKAIWIESVKLNGDRSTPDGARAYVKDGCLHIESEFPEKLEEYASDFLTSKICESKKNTVTFGATFTDTKDVRNIYYKDFGAVGDGQTEDFFAIKACHDYANKWGHTVNADCPLKNYYIGNYLDYKGKPTSIVVQTDTNWHGCTFTFDDTVVLPNSACYNSPIFHITPDNESTAYSGANVPFTSLMKGATDLGGWKPGVRCLIVIENSNNRHFIRYGSNADDGLTQQELILVNPDGTIDKSTPLHWDYEKITKITIYPCDDKTITVTGGDGSTRATVITKFNNAPSRYTYFWRNILVERSNTILQNINHVVEGEIPREEGGSGAPYKGFIRANYANDVTVQNVQIHKLRGYTLETDASNSMGSYEMGSSHSNNLVWKNITQNVFYDADGGVSGQGLMGTGYCKNMILEDCLLHSFDAHQGIYNVTLRRSIFEHINFIGDGTITLEDVTIYIDPKQRAITLRQDYGSHWQGDIVMKNVDLKYETKVTEKKNIHLIYAEWHNHYFGYTTYLPQHIYMENVNVLGFEVTVTDGVRNEKITQVNTKQIYLFTPGLYSYTDVDISNPEEDMEKHPNDYKECTCATRPDNEFYNAASIKRYFNDTDGDGKCNNSIKSPNGSKIKCGGFTKCSCASFTDTNNDYFCDDCKGFEEKLPSNVNLNPFIGTKTVVVKNENPNTPIQIIYPLTEQFDDMDVTVDGKLIIEDGKETDD